jgi:hypothetical protein
VSYTQPFPTSSVGNRTYSNHTAINHTLTGNNLASGFRVTSQLRNALNAYTPSSSAFSTLYPPSQSIGYISGWNPATETNIPKKTSGNPLTLSNILTQTRMSVTGSSPTNPTDAEVVDINNGVISSNDALYNPFDSKFYATGLDTSLTNYILPSQAFPSGTKHLLINASVDSRATTFTLYFRYLPAITNLDVYVKWAGTGWGTPKWYNAKIFSTVRGIGAGLSSPLKDSTTNIVTFPIQINLDDFSTVTNTIGNIYLNIRFTTGDSELNSIVIS